MAASEDSKDDSQFWKLVWPQLKNGGWRYELAPPQAAMTSDQSDEASPSRSGRRISPRTRSRTTTSSSTSSTSSTARTTRRDPLAVAATAPTGAAGAPFCSPPRAPGSIPVFFPPEVGAASEALEEAMRRSAPADGSLDEERLDRLVGVASVIELLQQVPGYPGTTVGVGIINFDAVAAAARGVLVRTPSPTTSGAHRREARTPAVAGTTRAAELRLGGRTPEKTPPRSRSSSVSSSDEAVERVDEPRPVRIRGGSPSSMAENAKLQQPAPSSVGSGPVASAATGPTPSQPLSSSSQFVSPTGDSRGSALVEGITSPAAAATRLGRVIKKPVRLDEHNLGRQTLPGRNGRADAPAKVAARAAAAAAATGEPAGGSSSANGRVVSQAISGGISSAAGKTATAEGGSERCVARLGTAAVSDGGGTEVGTILPRAGSKESASDVGKTKLSGTASAASGSPAGSVIRMALPADGRTAGLQHRERDTEEAGGEGGGDSARRSRVLVNERDPMALPDPLPERPVGGLGSSPEDAIKEYKRAYDDIVWPGLVNEFGWKKVHGPRVHDVYYLPSGVVRGRNGAKCRVDYYDSNRQVLIHMAENEQVFGSLLERAWAAAIAKPRVAGRKGGGGGGYKRRRRWTEQSRRKSTMMKKEYPKKVSLVGTAHQVDPLNLPVPVSSEDYVAPEDVMFEQVWDPIMLQASERAAAPLFLDALVEDFAGVVSQDKCLEIIYRCRGDHGEARRSLRSLLRAWKSCYPVAAMSMKETAAAKATVAKETSARLAAAPPPSWSAASTSSSSSSKMPAPSYGDDDKGKSTVNAGGGGRGGPGSCPIVAGSTTVNGTTTRSAVAWGGGAAAAASRGVGVGAVGGSSSASSSGSRGVRGHGGRAGTRGVQDAFWHRPLKSLEGGEAALKRQVEGGVSNRPPGARGRDKVASDLDLSRPWLADEAEMFTRALLDEGSKNFYAVQKVLPDRQLCELVDRYYGGWKQTDGYKTLKESIRLSKKQSACGGCHAGGDLICCDGCDAVYHPECVGISVVPEGDWFCPACVVGKKKDTEKTSGQGQGQASTTSFFPAAARAPAIPSRAMSGQPNVESAVAATKNEIAPGRCKRASPMTTTAAEIASAAANAASSKKARAVSFDKEGGSGSRSNGNGGGGSGAPRVGSGFSRSVVAGPQKHHTSESAPPHGGGGRPPPPSPMRMERVPIQLGAARGAAGGAARVPQAGSSGTGTGAAAVSASSAIASSADSGRDGRTSVKRTIVGATPEQHPEKRTAGAVKITAAAAAAAAPSRSVVKAPARTLASRSPFPAGGTITGIPGGRLGQKPAIAATTAAPKGDVSLAGCDWGCLGCKHRNRAEDKRCRQCEGLRLVGVEVNLTAISPVTPAPPASAPLAAKTPVAAAVAVPIAGTAPLLGNKNEAPQKSPPSPPPQPPPQPPPPASAESNASSVASALASVKANEERSAVTAHADSTSTRAAAAYMAAPSRSGMSDPPLPRSSLWACRACSTSNKQYAMVCVSCGTRKEVKPVDKGKPQWWCCRKCSRFNNRQQDGNTCRICLAVGGDEAEKEEEEEQEDEGEEEVISVDVEEDDISVGEDKPKLASSVSGVASRFVQL